MGVALKKRGGGDSLPLLVLPRLFERHPHEGPSTRGPFFPSSDSATISSFFIIIIIFFFFFSLFLRAWNQEPGTNNKSGQRRLEWLKVRINRESYLKAGWILEQVTYREGGDARQCSQYLVEVGVSRACSTTTMPAPQKLTQL